MNPEHEKFIQYLGLVVKGLCRSHHYFIEKALIEGEVHPRHIASKNRNWKRAEVYKRCESLVDLGIFYKETYHLPDNWKNMTPKESRDWMKENRVSRIQYKGWVRYKLDRDGIIQHIDAIVEDIFYLRGIVEGHV